jgi:L-amino acid N-acyltransferase YncA
VDGTSGGNSAQCSTRLFHDRSSVRFGKSDEHRKIKIRKGRGCRSPCRVVHWTIVHLAERRPLMPRAGWLAEDDRPVTIRVATVADAPSVASIHVRSWQAAYAGLLPQPFLDSLDPATREAAWRKSLTEADWPRQGTVVDQLDHDVVGFASVCPARDQRLAPAGEVRSIYVDPAAWAIGHGRRLLEAATGGLRDAGFAEAILWVAESNTKALRFYQRNGWRDTGTRKIEVVGGVPITEGLYARDLTD